MEFGLGIKYNRINLKGSFGPPLAFSPLYHTTKETLMLKTLELHLYFCGLFNDASSSQTTERRMKGDWWKNKLERIWKEQTTWARDCT